MGFSEGKVEEMLVAVGEAVTNAVVHGAPNGETAEMDAVTIHLVVRNSDITIAVTSPRTGWKASPRPRADLMAERGRGLLMIQSLTDTWRVRQGAGGTTVYLTWRLPRHPLARDRRRPRAS